MDSPESILEEAQRLTNGERRESYGPSLDDHSRTAALWTPLLRHKLRDGATIEWHDVIRCMIALKLSRDCHSMQRETVVDTAGYAWCRQEALEEAQRRKR